MRQLLIILSLFSILGHAHADMRPAIAIIIDDIGYRADQDRKALALPGPLAYAILPHTPGAAAAIKRATSDQREILLHMPMEASSRTAQKTPGTLTQSMDWIDFVRMVQKNMAAVPGIIAINNHEGSLLTTNPERMQWLMEELSTHRGLAFIDSRTTHRTVALKTALQNALPATRRDIFLDYEPGKIAQQFKELIDKAKTQGTALAIAHPREETIVFLKKQLPRLERYGVKLISVSQLLQRRHQNIITRRAHVKGVSTAR